MSTALLRASVCLQRRCVPGQVLSPTAPPLQVRGKKQQQKKKFPTKLGTKDAMKNYLRQMELKEVTEAAAIRAAKHGEPLDPEMLNPARKRPAAEVSPEERERRFLLVKEYSRYRMEHHKRQLGALQGVVAARRRALLELRKVSVPLYLQALELSRDLFPFFHSGPTAMPPIPGYVPPDLED